jgi:hypothetical protein
MHTSNKSTRREMMLTAGAATASVALTGVAAANATQAPSATSLAEEFYNATQQSSRTMRSFIERFSKPFPELWRKALDNHGLEFVEILTQREWDARIKARTMPGIGDRICTPRYTWDMDSGSDLFFKNIPAYLGDMAAEIDAASSRTPYLDRNMVTLVPEIYVDIEAYMAECFFYTTISPRLT